MKKPTKEQLNNFWKNTNEFPLRYIMECVKDKEIRDKAEKYLPEEKVNVFDYLISKE